MLFPFLTLDIIPAVCYFSYLTILVTNSCIKKSSNQKVEIMEIWQNLEKKRVTDHEFPPPFIKCGVGK